MGTKYEKTYPYVVRIEKISGIFAYVSLRYIDSEIVLKTMKVSIDRIHHPKELQDQLGLPYRSTVLTDICNRLNKSYKSKKLLERAKVTKLMQNGYKVRSIPRKCGERKTSLVYTKQGEIKGYVGISENKLIQTI